MQRILIAETSKPFTKALVAAFSSHYEIHTCSTGAEAVSLINRLRPDLLIINLSLPLLDGISVLHTATYKPLISLAITTVATEAILRAAANIHLDSIILKPCSIRSVMKTVEEWPNADPAEK